MPWSARFDASIALPDRKRLTTLQEAADYVIALPAAEQRKPHWQAAIAALIVVAEHNGPTMLARIGMMRAINSEAPGTAAIKPPAKLLR